jgi:hypothetical protein
LKTLTYWQAWGVLALSCILFGKVGGGGSSSKSDRKRMRELPREPGFSAQTESIHPGLFPKGVVMKVLRVVSSFHHRNTEKIADVFARVFDARRMTPRQTTKEELQDFNPIGFGSGIDSDRHYMELLNFADALPRAEDTKRSSFRRAACRSLWPGETLLLDMP